MASTKEEKASGSKSRNIEKTYQKKTQLEHILLRPDTYVGSVEPTTQLTWAIDDEDGMVQKEIKVVPGLYKIYDEILVNAADNKQRDKSMQCIRVDIDARANTIRIWNDGRGIPVTIHREYKVHVPSLIFGQLLTSSHYNDSEKKVTGGRNGFGAKLCNIFSTEFELETSSREFGKHFKQSWSNNMSQAEPPAIRDLEANETDFTCVTFKPDLNKFHLEKLSRDIVALFQRRAYDVAATSGCRVMLNGKRVPITSFREYVEMFTKRCVDEQGEPVKFVHDRLNQRWEVAVAPSSGSGFQQVSFVNSIATVKGGTHVDYITEQIVRHLTECLRKRSAKEAVRVTPNMVRSNLFVFVNCLIENPAFDSQTKETLTLAPEKFGSRCELTDTFLKKIEKCGVLEQIQSWLKFKAQEKMDSTCSKKKFATLKGIPKLDDANWAGTKQSDACTLILTEGDSAKSLAVSGLSVVGRDRFGVFPLRGKILNVREASAQQILKNAEIQNLVRILGLQYKQRYETAESLRTLRYGRIMIMTDQDQDGSHIKGLLINFLHHNWPHLLRHGFIEQFITPIVKVFSRPGAVRSDSDGRSTGSRKIEEHSFYSLPEFEEWKRATPNAHTYRVKYYKGLGTSTSNEAKRYFADMLRHRISFRYSGADDDKSLVLAFSKKMADDRKRWLTEWMRTRRARLNAGLSEDYLYNPATRSVSFGDFVNKELILFSNMDNERSIPSVVDGLKPGQRKVLFACFRRNLRNEIKVAQLAGCVAELSAYHHGEQSLMQTITNLAQNFVGSNNVPLLRAIGMFGTRLQGGKDAASPRYIFTALSPVARALFREEDDASLRYLFEDNQRVEPEYYVPAAPLVLLNGADGIGTGWMTKIPNYSPAHVLSALRRLIKGEPRGEPLAPSYAHFRGTIKRIDPKRYAVFGECAVLDDESIEITELPIGTWTQAYKENVLEEMLLGSEKRAPTITGYKEYHTDTTVRFVVRMTNSQLRAFERIGLHKAFKLVCVLSLSSMVLFDASGCIKRYESVEEILDDFYSVRLEAYAKRKSYLLEKLEAEVSLLENQARFIVEKCENSLVVENRSRSGIVELLRARKYDADPERAWRNRARKREILFVGEADAEDAEAAAEADSSNTAEKRRDASEAEVDGHEYDYLLRMPMWALTLERKNELLRERDRKRDELHALKTKTIQQMWLDDLDAFENTLSQVEALDRDEQSSANSRVNKAAAGASKDKFVRRPGNDETRPSPEGIRVEPPGVEDYVAAASTAPKRTVTDVDFDSLLNGDEDSAAAAPGGGSQSASPAKKSKKQADTTASKQKAVDKGDTMDFDDTNDSEPRRTLDDSVPAATDFEDSGVADEAKPPAVDSDDELMNKSLFDRLSDRGAITEDVRQYFTAESTSEKPKKPVVKKDKKEPAPASPLKTSTPSKAKPKAAEKPKATARKPKAEPKAKKAAPKAKGKSKKKKASSDEEDDDDDDSDSDVDWKKDDTPRLNSAANDDDGDRRPKRTAAKKTVKYAYGDDDSQADSDGSAADASKSKKRRLIFDDDESEVD